MKHFLAAAGLTLAAAGAALAQPTIDGSISGDATFYGAALSSQNTKTGFGDNTSIDTIDTATGGSEINEIFAVNDGTNLNVLITGNLENNFNKMVLFFDVDGTAGGVNTLDGSALPPALDGFCCFQSDPTTPGINPGPDGTLGTADDFEDGALQRMTGLTFDAGFAADKALAFTNGGESVNGGDPDEDTREFWAFTAHYADLTAGAAGDATPLGVQLSPRGLNQLHRFPFDYNGDGVLNAADYTVAREAQELAPNSTPIADGNGDGVVDGGDILNWATNYGENTGPDGSSFLASDDFLVSEAQLLQNAVTGANVLPGLSQGDLIDNAYATTTGGCTDNEGTGCIVEELEFVLEPAADETDNGSNHRLFTNTVGLKAAIDNSNIDGVGADFGDASAVAADPGAAATATTGIEFSIPLASLGASGTDAIALTAFVTSGDYGFASNQFSGVGVLDLNLGGLLFGGDVDDITLADVPGDQFVTIPAASPSASVPEPGAALLAALAVGLGLAGRRR